MPKMGAMSSDETKNTAEKFNGSETVSDILLALPEAAEIMGSFGLSCVNCAVNAYESLQDGVKLHGWDKARLDELLGELNLAYKEGGGGGGLKIMNAARDEVYELQRAEQMEGYGLRVDVTTGDDGEVEFFLDFEEIPKENDEVLRSNGVSVFAEGKSVDYLRRAVIDYNEGEFVIEENLKQH